MVSHSAIINLMTIQLINTVSYTASSGCSLGWKLKFQIQFLLWFSVAMHKKKMSGVRQSIEGHSWLFACLLSASVFLVVIVIIVNHQEYAELHWWPKWPYLKPTSQVFSMSPIGMRSQMKVTHSLPVCPVNHNWLWQHYKWAIPGNTTRRHQNGQKADLFDARAGYKEDGSGSFFNMLDEEQQDELCQDVMQVKTESHKPSKLTPLTLRPGGC